MTHPTPFFDPEIPRGLRGLAPGPAIDRRVAPAGPGLRPRRTRKTVSILACLAFLTPIPLLAEPYRLTPGDSVHVHHAGRSEGPPVLIDLDGALRLPGLPAVAAARADLDTLRRALDDALVEAGLYVDPRASVGIAQYAPVTVAGDVQTPGPLAYLPGLSVRAALARAGGVRLSGLTPPERLRAEAEARGALAIARTEDATETLRIARLQATLNAAPLPPLADLLPGQGTQLAPLHATQATLLEAARTRLATLTTLRTREIETMSRQIALFDDRIAVQEEMIARTASDLADMQALRERGLQTLPRLSETERRATEARARALELEAARIAALRARAEAERGLAQLRATFRTETLQALQEAQARKATAQARAARWTRQLARLGAGDIVPPDLRLESLRPGRSGAVTDLDLTLLPGDTLIVALPPESGGG